MCLFTDTLNWSSTYAVDSLTVIGWSGYHVTKRERGEWRGRVLAVWRHLLKTIFTGTRRFLEFEVDEHVHEGLGKGGEGKKGSHE